MTSEHAPLIPPDPESRPAGSRPPESWNRTAAGGTNDRTNDGARHSELLIQRNRGWCYLIAGAGTLLAGISGGGAFQLRATLAVLACGYLSTLGFGLAARRAERANRRVDLKPWWISGDVLLITAVIGLTGGVESPCYVWYLACAGAAAAHCSYRFAVAGGAATALLYFGLLAGMGQIRGLDQGFLRAATHLVFLFGASLFLLFNTRQLRQSSLANRRLKEEAVARVEELTGVTRDLEAMSRLLGSFTEADPLTGLQSRRSFLDRLAEDAGRLGRDRRGAGSAGLGSNTANPDAGFLMVDVDDLAAVNASHGRAAGDAVLKHLAKVLRRCVRHEDRLARWGGDELLVLLPRTQRERIPEVVERMVTAIGAQPCRLADGSLLPVSCSVGWSAFDWRPRADGAAPWEGALAAAAEMAAAAAPAESPAPWQDVPEPALVAAAA